MTHDVTIENRDMLAIRKIKVFQNVRKDTSYYDEEKNKNKGSIFNFELPNWT